MTKLDNIIVLNDGIPPLGSPEFLKWLEAWHKENNEPRFKLTGKGRDVLAKCDTDEALSN